MSRPRVVFLCTGNACRSQMAEGFLRALGGDRYAASSAGTHPSTLHPLTLRVMKEAGVDISRQYSKGIPEVEVDKAAWIVTLCSDADEHCPVLPAAIRREHWPVTDPNCANGSPEVVLDVFRQIRDEIRSRVQGLLDETVPHPASGRAGTAR